MEHYATRALDGTVSSECQTGETYTIIQTFRDPNAMVDDIEDAVALFLEAWHAIVRVAYAAQPGQSLKKLRKDMKLFWRVRPQITRLRYISERTEARNMRRLKNDIQIRQGWAIYARCVLSRKRMVRRK